MKQETNKEIDLLLRRLSRRDGEAVLNGEIEDHHLDADELSSYAQNVLPATARARYTAHLAECSTCRRLATELSLASGVTIAAPPVVAVPASSSLKKFVSSLFSPMVLRYAVPALGVIVVMVVGFVVLRQRRASDGMVAQVEANRRAIEQKYGDTPATPAPLANQTEPGRAQQPAKQDSTTATTEPRKTESANIDERAAEGRAKSDAPATTGTGAFLAQTPPAPAATPNDSTAFTPQVTSPSPVQPFVAPKAGIATDGETAAKKEVAKREVAQATVEQQEAKDKAQANEPAPANLRPGARIAADRAAQNKTKPEAPTVATAGAGERAQTRRRAEAESDDVETRTIAGRKFRKERGIWTDTAYDSSIRIVQMARGSEQFRGLVADEPAIGTIAEQLDGEVIVVWKGRAYRIR
jgi:hypothetical protein